MHYLVENSGWRSAAHRAECRTVDRAEALGAGIQNLLEITGIQQDLLDPVLGLVGSLGGLFTS